MTDSMALRGSSPGLAKELELLSQDELRAEDYPALERTVWRKLDRWILPFCAVYYLLSFLDRSNIANARVAGMQTSLKMSNYQYSTALTVTYVPYIAAELPSNLLLKYVGPDLMLPTMVTIWGVVATLQGVVKSYPGLLVCRFFLGMMEGGLFPGLVLYLSSFYPREMLHIRIATFFSSASLSGAFSGLLAAAIDQMNGIGGKPGWAWIFILEGLFTFVFGFISFFFLPRSPATARFLSKEERSYVLSRLRRSGAIARDEKSDGFKWIEVLRSVRSPHVLLLAVVLFFGGTILYSLAYFEPTIVQGLGYAGNRAQLMSVPPFATAFVVSMISAVLSDRFGWRGFTTIFFSLLCIVGFCMFHATTAHSLRYGSLFFSVTGAYGAASSLATWAANNSAPHIRRATTIAVMFIMTNSGGILATWLLGSLSPAPNYTKATITFIVMSACMILFSTLNLIYLWRRNCEKAERRLFTKKEEELESLGDRSAWFVYNL